MLILAAVCRSACSSSVAQVGPEAQVVKPASSSPSNDVECSVENYKPRSRAELQAMSPRELIAERVKSNPWDSFDSYFEGAEYEDSIVKLLRKDVVKALPVISEYFDSYDPTKSSHCVELRFAIVSRVASDIDRFDYRLRASKEGLAAIHSLERALQRIIKTVPGLTFDNGPNSRHQPAAFMFLRQLKGINLADRNVADTLWVRYKIKLSDDELLEFTNYLILLDPKYPGWSTDKFMKDYSRINEAGNPAQVYFFYNAKRFYDAYKRFRKSKEEVKSMPQ